MTRDDRRNNILEAMKQNRAALTISKTDDTYLFRFEFGQGAEVAAYNYDCNTDKIAELNGEHGFAFPAVIQMIANDGPVKPKSVTIGGSL